jgi:hypothetical protein
VILALSAPAAGVRSKTARASAPEDRPAQHIPTKKRRENNKISSSSAAKLRWTAISGGSSVVCQVSDDSPALPGIGFIGGHEHRGPSRFRAIEIGRARLVVSGDKPLINHALVLTEGPSSSPDPYVPDATKYRWLRLGVPGHMQEDGTQVDPTAVARIKIPTDFVAKLNAILTPGATVFVTSASLSSETSGTLVQVVDADPPSGKRSVRN